MVKSVSSCCVREDGFSQISHILFIDKAITGGKIFAIKWKTTKVSPSNALSYNYGSYCDLDKSMQFPRHTVNNEVYIPHLMVC